MNKIVYMLTHDPRERTALISSALTQALDAIKSGYECEIFLTDDAVKLILPESTSAVTEFVNASKLIESALEAEAVFTY